GPRGVAAPEDADARVEEARGLAPLLAGRGADAMSPAPRQAPLRTRLLDGRRARAARGVAPRDGLALRASGAGRHDPRRDLEGPRAHARRAADLALPARRPDARGGAPPRGQAGARAGDDR